jgi:hypothetical protein
MQAGSGWLRPGRSLIALAMLAAAGLVTPAHAQMFGNRESGVEVAFPDPPPPPPDYDRLVSFDIGRNTTNTFAFDPASVTPVEERAVRFTLVVTSASGVRNVTYEAFRCDRDERKLLAIGRPDGSWSPARTAEWKAVRDSDMVNRVYPVLHRALCIGGAATQPVSRAIDALKARPTLGY